MDYKKIISILAIILSIIGTYLIWYNSQQSISALAELLMETSSKIGYWQMHPIDEKDINEFNYTLAQASNLDKRGFIFLMIGFGLQTFLIFDFKKCRKYIKTKVIQLLKPKSSK